MKPLEKIDLWTLHKDEYVAPKKPVLVQTGPARYLAIHGRGAPGGPEFEQRTGALYAMAYTLKMTRKFAGLQDYSIGKLETLYWMGGEGECASAAPMAQWRWQVLIRTPEFVEETERTRAVEVLLQKGKPAEVKEVRFEDLNEGRCVQMLHVGAYERVPETVEIMRVFAEGQGLTFGGPHHEIYLSDPRRVAPDKLKTILRHPVK